MRDIDLTEIAEIAPPKAPVVVKPKAKKKKTTPKVGRPKVIKGKKIRPVQVDTTPKPKAPSVPSSKDVEKIIADLGIEIPELIDIPGVGQVRIPSVSAAPLPSVSAAPLPSVSAAPPPSDVMPGEVFMDEPKYIPPPEPAPSPTAPIPTGSYESSYIDWMESEPEPFTMIRPKKGGSKRYREAKKAHDKSVADWKASKPKKADFAAPAPVAVAPDPILEVSQPPPEPAPSPTPPPEPPVNPFKDYVPMNILGQSFDPSAISYQKQEVADARARQTPGANIQGGGYLTYDNPILGNKQTQFGGYGQPMPTAPLMNYAGLGSNIVYAPPTQASQSQPASGATVDPNTGKIEPIGIAPPPQIRNPIT